MIPNDVTPTTENRRDACSTQTRKLTRTDEKVVHYTTSEKVLSANRRNTLRSTGPRTAKGKAVSRMNAVKHGILSTEVVVRGLRIQEREDEFRALREQCWQCLAPVGSVEEMLVDRIVTAQWRLRRVLMAETGEIVLSVDGGLRRRANRDPLPLHIFMDKRRDAAEQMEKSTQGLEYLDAVLSLLREDVEREGGLTEGVYEQLLKRFIGQPNSLTRDFVRLRERFVGDSSSFAKASADASTSAQASADAEELKESRRRTVLRFIEEKLAKYEELSGRSEEREDKEETAQQLANVLPSAAVLDKILRYENALERQLYRAMNQLERLQRRREGEEIPPPVTLQLSRG